MHYMMSMSTRARSTEIHEFICPDCGRRFPIPRKKSNRREKGHVKDIYCPFCREVKKFEETY